MCSVGGSRVIVVNGNRNLTSWRNVKTDQLRCSWFVGRSGDAAEVSVFEPVGVAFEGDDVGVVDEPVDHRGGDDLIAEDLAPPAERLVAGDDERGAFVSGGDELEEQVGGLGFEGDVADFVDDQQRVAAEPGELGLEPPGVVGLGEAGDPSGGGGEQHPVPGLAGPDRQPDREMGFAGAGRLQGELIRLGRYPLLVVDEVGYIPFEAEAANLFFQLVSSRYERASLIVTSNKPFGRWGEVFGDDVVAAAMIDRLVHHAEVISLKGDSYRLKDRDLGRVPHQPAED